MKIAQLIVATTAAAMVTSACAAGISQVKYPTPQEAAEMNRRLRAVAGDFFSPKYVGTLGAPLKEKKEKDQPKASAIRAKMLKEAPDIIELMVPVCTSPDFPSVLQEMEDTDQTARTHSINMRDLCVMLSDVGILRYEVSGQFTLLIETDKLKKQQNQSATI